MLEDKSPSEAVPAAATQGAQPAVGWCSTMVKITVFDGSSTIGGNKIYLEEGDEAVFLDFGMNFARYGEFFQEFLSERDTRGIHDLIHLGMIPRISPYRRDLIPSDLDTSSFRTLAPKAVLLSHAHLDHCGNISLLDRSIPVVASGVTAAILKGMRDTGASGMGSEVAYISTRVPHEDYGGLILSSGRGTPYMGRDFYCTDCADAISEFMSQKPGQGSRNSKKLEPGAIRDLSRLRLHWNVDAYPVDHSIYGATAYVLRGETTVAYTGDMRLSGRNRELTRKFMQGARSADVLICEGTRVGRAHDSDVTEDEVMRNCLAAVEGSGKLTVADFSARNFERLDMFIEIAERTGRRLVITAKDAYLINAIECADGSHRLDSGAIGIYHEMSPAERKWESEVVKPKWGGAYVAYDCISRAPGDYILCFSLFDMKHLLDIKPEGGSYIYSSSEAFSEEQEIDFRRLKAWLDRFGFSAYGFHMEGEEGAEVPRFEKGYHASGHLSADEIIGVIKEIGPGKIVPVHTEDPGWFREQFGDRVVLPEEGKTIDA